MENQNSRNCWDLAHEYLKRGWEVLPLHWIENGRCSCSKQCSSIGKHPLTPRGVKDATSDTKAIEIWKSKWPLANIGIATGRRSNLTVLDVDPRHGGDDSLRQLEKFYSPIALTIRALTGGGGIHYYFKYSPQIFNRVGFRPGLDIKSDGGYVVAPTSMHTSGRRYAWDVDAHPDNVVLDSIPVWLFRTSMKRGAQSRPFAESVSVGARNNTLASLAGTLVKKLDSRLALNLLLGWNQRFCDPPLEDSEVIRTHNSISQLEFRKRD